VQREHGDRTIWIRINPSLRVNCVKDWQNLNHADSSPLAEVSQLFNIREFAATDAALCVNRKYGDVNASETRLWLVWIAEKCVN